VQLASSDKPTSRAVIVVSGVGSLAFNAGVNGAGDGLVCTKRLVLVDERGPLTVVTHPHHAIPKTHAAPGREVIARMPQVVEMQAFSSYRSHGIRPSGLAVEVSTPQRPAFRSGEHECTWILIDEA